MSKAEEKSLEAYPVIMETLIPVDKENPEIKQDCNKFLRQAYIQGYNQAEKELDLTWEDIRDIIGLYDESTGMDHCNDIYEDVLKRFKTRKNICI